MSDMENTTVLDEVQALAQEQQTHTEQEDVSEIEQEQIEDQTLDVEQQEQKPEKKWVEFTPEQQKKFNDVYKQVKMSDERNKILTQMLETQQAQLDELKQRFSKTDQAEAENILKTRLQEAREYGDLDMEMKILKEINDFYSGAKAQPEQKQVKKQEINLPEEPEARYVVALAQETDDSGQPLRPWLSENHPRYKTMLTQASIIAAEFDARGEAADITIVMKELDKRMNAKQNTRAPDPFSANLTTSRASSNIKPKLSAQEKAIAAKLGMSEADYLDGKLNYR